MMIIGISTLYNILIYDVNENKTFRKQFYAKSISEAIKQSEEFGKVVKVTEALWDNESHLY